MKYFLLSFLLISTLFSSELKLTKKQANYVADKVWQNEGAGLDKYLIHWNVGENFASVGIGHFIWFAKGHKEKFREVFPMLVKFMEQRSVKMPYWLNHRTHLPWKSKKIFYRAKKAKTKKYRELFKFLKKTKSYQAEFMAKRLTKALPKILAVIKNPRKKANIKWRFNHILYNKNGTINAQGLYILLDYVNFKGEGTLASEGYHGEGWGLLQVLENMKFSKNKSRFKSFGQSASYVLSRRIKNSPKKRGEERWRKGWNVRLKTYWNY